MRAKAFIGIAMFLVLISYSSAQSQQRPFSNPHPVPPPVAQDQRGTDQQPLSVKIVPAEKTDAERDDEQKHRDNEAKLSASAEQLARFAYGLFLVGIAQLLLFAVQLWFIGASFRDARKAAEAAKLNADALIDAERGRIFVNIEQDTADAIRSAARHANSPEKDGNPLDGSVGLFYGLKNYGKTPAIIRELGHQLVLAPELATEREHSPKTPLPIESVLGPGEQTPRGTLVCSFDRKITIGEGKEILALRNALWFYGYVAYDDTFGFGRELRYVFRYDGGTGGRFRLHSFQELQSQKRDEDEKSTVTVAADEPRAIPDAVPNKEDSPPVSASVSSPEQTISDNETRS
jgi:hypothetical protein